MSFLPWKFSRIPPQTVPSAYVAPTGGGTTAPAGATSSTPSTSGAATNTSRATALISQLSDLAGMAQYLQSVILSLTTGLGVTVNTNTNPDLAQALSSIYGSVPAAVSIQMYSSLLDVEFGAQQVLLATGLDASIQPNPFQQQAVITINKAVESALSSDGSFSAQAPLMLRNLKTQTAVYAQWQSSLAQYPASTGITGSTSANVIQASSVDVGDDVNQALSDHITAMTSTYASAFTLMAGTSSVSQDIVSIVATFATLSVVELAQIKSLFTLVQSTSASESLQDTSNGITSFVFVQMLSSAASMVFSLDRVNQMAIVPLSSMSNPLGSGLSSAQGQATSPMSGVVRTIVQTARVSSGVLSGMLASNSSTGGSPPSGLTAGMNDLNTLLDWSLQQASGKNTTTLLSFTKLMGRTQNDTSSQVQLLSVINNLGTLASLAGSFLTQNGTGAAAATPVTQLATVGAILAATNTGNGTTYTIQNGAVTVNPPAVPTPTPAASVVLANAGVSTQLAGLSQSL
jgi:hypothetical protein